MCLWGENMFCPEEAPYDQSLNLKRRLGFEFETERGWSRGKIKSRYQLYMVGWEHFTFLISVIFSPPHTSSHSCHHPHYHQPVNLHHLLISRLLSFSACLLLSFYQVCVLCFPILVYMGGSSGKGDKFAYGGDTFKLKVSWIN